MTRPRRSLAPLILGLLLAGLAAFAAGCGGGGGSDSSETALRKKLEAGAQKVKTAKSARVSLAFEVETDGEEPQELGCVNLATETAKPERFDLTFFDQNCQGGLEAHELIAVGSKAWASSSGPQGEGAGKWEEARITPRLRKELTDEQTDVDQLFSQADKIEEHEGDAAVEEGGESHFVDVPSYTFEAPASAFPGAGEDLGDLNVEFEAVLDRKGYLRELVIHGEEEGTGATVTATYDDIDQDLGVEPPDPKEVHGSVRSIDSKADLDALFGVTTP
jgi:hypothetical protein